MAIKLASRYNAIAGGFSASGITALELSSLGPQAAVTVPAVATLVFADIAYSSRTQLRATYDLSVIHGAPISLNDAEDCWLIFLTAMGVKLHDLVGGIGKSVGPQVVAYNVRKMLRAGLRKAIQEALKRVGGVRLARLATERALMRLVVPGINVPISSGFNYYFTRQLLRVADVWMARRGAVVQPLVRLHAREPKASRTIGPKILIAIADAGDSEGWSEGQMEALRHCQSVLSLTDEELAEFEVYFDRNVEDLVRELPDNCSKIADDLIELSVVQAALADGDQYDMAYAEIISKLGEYCGTNLSVRRVARDIKTRRHRLAQK